MGPRRCGSTAAAASASPIWDPARHVPCLYVTELREWDPHRRRRFAEENMTAPFVRLAFFVAAVPSARRGMPPLLWNPLVSTRLPAPAPKQSLDRCYSALLESA